jgi:osmotically-inducible protein OsmY
LEEAGPEFEEEGGRSMNGYGYRAILGIAAATTLALMPACRKTAEGVREDARQNAEKAQQEANKLAHKIGVETRETGARIGMAAEEAGGRVAQGAKEVGDKVKTGAKEVASEVGAVGQTVDLRAHLLAARSIDASHIEVNTDAASKTVTLKGTVPTVSQKAAAEKLVREKAEGYKVRNLLTLATK